MKNKFHILFLFLLSKSILNAQIDSTKWTLKINPCKLSAGYFYQGDHFGEAGLKIDFIQNKTKDKQNISLIPGAQFTKHDKISYINPYLMLRYFKPLNYKIAFVTSISINYRQVQNIISTSLTPEIGINLSHTSTFSYGYNIFLDNKYSWTLPHRFALRIMLH